jgi:protein-S-isoprenylcysteine O-methyltransferase Ste14
LCKQEGNATFSGTIDVQEFPLPDYAVFILRFFFFCIAHSLFATNRVKQLFSRITVSEPRPYRLVYNLASFAMLGWVMASWSGSAVLYEVPGMGRWSLYGLQAVVAVVLLRCVCRTGSVEFLGISQLWAAVTSSHRLVTDGCYARVRHPLYLYSTLFLLLNPVMSVRWLLLTCFSVAYFIFGGWIEERRLLKEFGDDYREYRQRVPFMIPALSHLLDRD